MIIIIAISFIIVVILAWNSPTGWEDEKGFHRGEKLRISPKTPRNRTTNPRRSLGAALIPSGILSSTFGGNAEAGW